MKFLYHVLDKEANALSSSVSQSTMLFMHQLYLLLFHYLFIYLLWKVAHKSRTFFVIKFSVVYTNINHKVVRWMNENQTILLKIIMLCYIALHLLVLRYFVCFFFCTFNKWKLLYIISLHSLVSQVPTWDLMFWRFVA